MTEQINYQHKYEQVLTRLSAIPCNVINGDYCKHCYKFYMPDFLRKLLCGKCDAFSDLLSDIDSILEKADCDNTMDQLLQRIIDLEQECHSYLKENNALKQLLEDINDLVNLEVGNTIVDRINAKIDEVLPDE